MAREPNRSFGDDDATGGCMDCAWLGWVRRYGFGREGLVYTYVLSAAEQGREGMGIATEVST